MIFLLKNESMYLIEEKKIIHFYNLLQSHSHLTAYLTDFKHGYSFQLQVVLDLYIFLTTEQQKLFPNPFYHFERPLHAYIHELLSRQTEFKHVKQLHLQNDVFALIMSIFITKRVFSAIWQNIIVNDVYLMHENPLEFSISLDAASEKEQTIHLALQTYLLKQMKQYQMNFDYFKLLVTDCIQSAKELELLLRKEIL